MIQTVSEVARDFHVGTWSIKLSRQLTQLNQREMIEMRISFEKRTNDLDELRQI